MFRRMNCRGNPASVFVSVTAVCVSLVCVPVAHSQLEYHVYEGESIQAAIDYVWDVWDGVVVHPGTYYECIDFIGKAITVRSSDGPGLTRINGQQADEDVVTCNSEEGPDSVLDGFTITNSGEGRSGMLSYLTTPTVVNCIFTGNMGDGMHVDTSAPTVTDCVFDDNQGWGMYTTWFGYQTVTNCTFTNNGSGGIRGAEGNPIVTGCTFAYNGGVGLVLNYDAKGPVTDCSFLYNMGSGIIGGTWPDFLDVVNCRFVGNSAENGGGIRVIDGFQMRATNCEFVGNRADIHGGGVYLCWISEYVTLVNCTFSGNSAGSSGGAIYSEKEEAEVAAHNCIFWGNYAPDGPEIFGDVEVTYCNVEGGHEGEGNIDVDPLFVDPDNADLHLAPGSPCIDAGDSTAVPDGISTDLDDLPRFVDDPETPDTGVGYPCVDMGAYEYQGNDCPADVTGDDVVDIDDLFAVLAHWNEGAGIYDVNYDGIVDIDDIFEVLANWGPCP